MMPRGKRRSQPASGGDSGVEFGADVRAQTRRLAETLIDVTSSRANAAEGFAELHGIVSQLTELQKDFVLHPMADDSGRLEKARALLVDIQARGVDCSSLDVALFPDQGLGLRAKRPVARTEVLLEIPRRLIMSSEDAFASDIGEFLRADPVCQGMPSMALSVFLLHEAGRGGQSAWNAYIASLPSAFSNCLYFSPEEVKLLKGSAAQERVAADWRRICRQYAFFVLQLEKGKEAALLSFRRRFTFDDFRWAVAAVMSRNNPVPQTEQMGCALGLIPLWDLGNHKFGEMTTAFDAASLQLRFHAMEDAAEDEQILFHYGNRSNLDLLVYAGFAVPDNPFDRCPVRLGISEKDPLCLRRRTVLGKLGLGTTETFFLEANSGQLPQPLVAFVRVFVMDADELAAAEACPDLPALSAQILHPHLGQRRPVDERAVRFLRTRFALLAGALRRDWTQATAPFIRLVVDGERGLLEKALTAVDGAIAAMEA